MAVLEAEHKRIKKLSPLLINQLAAGEVVTRPAAVVKELLENAIDAGATDVTVRITQGGMGMIEVQDNGTGIHPDDMTMAVTRHATSKVADVAHLQGISTLGFRGEALASVAAVSRLTLTSSHDGSGIGRQLQVAGVLSDMPAITPVVHDQGTTVTVKDLYFNVPARRGNLKSIATEYAHIEVVVKEVALACVDIDFSLYHDNKKRLLLQRRRRNDSNLSLEQVQNQSEAHPLGQQLLPLARLETAWAGSLIDTALPVFVDLENLIVQESGQSQLSEDAFISGWLWATGCDTEHNTSKHPRLIYINGRLIKDTLITQKLNQVAQTAGVAHLGYALYFSLPVSWLNLNIHPSKQRIKIHTLSNVLAHLAHAVQMTLQSHLQENQNLNNNQAADVDTDVMNSADKFSDANPSETHAALQHCHEAHGSIVSKNAVQAKDALADFEEYLHGLIHSKSKTHAVHEPKRSYRIDGRVEEAEIKERTYDSEQNAAMARAPLLQEPPQPPATKNSELPIECVLFVENAANQEQHPKTEAINTPWLLLSRQGSKHTIGSDDDDQDKQIEENELLLMTVEQLLHVLSLSSPYLASVLTSKARVNALLRQQVDSVRQISDEHWRKQATAAASMNELVMMMLQNGASKSSI